MGFNHVSEEEKEGHFFFPKSTELEEIRKYFQTVAALLMAQKESGAQGMGQCATQTTPGVGAHETPLLRAGGARRNSNNLRYADVTILMAESEEELKNHLMKVKEESEKVGLKLNILKTKIMASGP